MCLQASPSPEFDMKTCGNKRLHGRACQLIGNGYSTAILHILNVLETSEDSQHENHRTLQRHQILQ